MNNFDYLSSSWLNVQYYDICGFNFNINSSVSFTCFESVCNSDEMFENIAEIWNYAELAQDDAVASWIRAHL